MSQAYRVGYHRGVRALPVVVSLSTLAPSVGFADTQTMVALDPSVDVDARRAVLDAAAKLRTLVEPLPLPELASSAERSGREDFMRASLERARVAAAEADWPACVKEAGDGLSESDRAIEDGAPASLLRELHLQIGVCLVQARVDTKSGEGVASARPHFERATLLSEESIPSGLFRSEAEALLAEVRTDVLARASGSVLIESDPPGATVTLDGRLLEGVTPLTVEVRLGEHLVGLRRARFEPTTLVRFLQPSATVRVELDPLRRSALGQELAAAAAAEALSGEPAKGAASAAWERQIALAAWSRADELLVAEPLAAPRVGVALRLYGASDGVLVRESVVADAADADAVGLATCKLLGGPCDESGSIDVPWYVWPLAGLAIAGGVVTGVVLAQSSRDIVLCPSTGC